MSDGLSATFANAILNILSGTAPTTYSSIYLALHTGDPGTAGTANASAGSTSRAAVNMGAATNSSNTSTTTTSSAPQWTNGGPTETITDLSAWSAISAGTFLFSVTVGTSKTWSLNDTLQLGSLSVSLPSAS